MDFDAVLLPPRREKMLQEGYWLNKTILDSLNEAVYQYPDKVALVSYKIEDQSEKSFTYREKRYRILPITQLVGVHFIVYRLSSYRCCT